MPVGGHVVPIVLSHESLSPVLKGLHGVTLWGPSGMAIYIDASSPREIQDYVVFHELCVHAVISQGRMKFAAAEEERFARAVSAPAMQLFKHLGFAWPRRPRGAARLETYARKKEGST